MEPYPQITCFGLTTLDHIYFQEDEEIKYSHTIGGGSGANVCLYLQAFGLKCELVSKMGKLNDYQLAINDLKALNVEINKVYLEENKYTREFFEIIQNGKHKFRSSCPICGYKAKSYPFLRFNSKLFENLAENLKSKLWFFDRTSKSLLKIAEKGKNKNIPLAFDLGTISTRYFQKDILLDTINLANIIQIPEKKNKFLMKQLEIESLKDINQNLEIYIITSDKNSILAQLNNDTRLEIPLFRDFEVKDAAGAGDVFFASFLYQIISKNTSLKNINNAIFKEALEFANKAAAISCFFNGARGFLYDYLERKKKNPELSLDQYLLNFDIQNPPKELIQINKGFGKNLKDYVCPNNNTNLSWRKINYYIKKKEEKKSLFETNIELIPDVIEFALKNLEINENPFQDSNFFQFVGSGGSNIVALAIKHLFESLNPDNIGLVFTPFEYILNGKLNKPVALISAGSTNPDIKNAFKRSKDLNSQKILLLTSNPNSKVLEENSKLTNGQNLLIPNPYEEKGFVAIFTLISHLIATSKVMLNNNWSKEHDDFFNRKRIKDYLLEKKREIAKTFESELQTQFKNLKKLHIVGLGAGWATPALCDLESKIVESGLATIEISELKNYTHGRYLSLYKYPEDKIVIIYKSPNTKELSNFLTRRLREIAPVIVLESKYDDFRGTFEFLILTFLFINQLGNILGIDPSKPGFPKEAKGLYDWEKIY